MNLSNLKHDLSNLKTKIEILTDELTEQDVEAKSIVYQDLVKTLEQAGDILKNLNE